MRMHDTLCKPVSPVGSHGGLGSILHAHANDTKAQNVLFKIVSLIHVNAQLLMLWVWLSLCSYCVESCL